MFVVTKSDQYEQGRSCERSPLKPHDPSTSYGVYGTAPCPPSDGYHTTHDYQLKRDSSRPATTRCGTFVFLIVVAQFAAFLFFCDLPSKLDDYSKATAQMHEQQEAMKREAKHLESERFVLRCESDRLDKERLALESATLEMEGERDALESAIRRSEQERERLVQEKQLLERERHFLELEKEELKEERHLLELEKEELREERKKWEKAREVRVPQGAFWETPPQPAPYCLSYGKREYSGALQNIPKGWSGLDACMNMPIQIKGVSFRRPYRCAYVEGSPHIHGYWIVDWDQPDCKPWYRYFHDKVRDKAER